LLRWATAGGVPWDDTVENYWIDDQTRVVIIDVSVYNPSLRIVTVVRLVVEITDTGQARPSFMINTMRQRKFFDPNDFESWCEWGLLLLIGILTIRDVLEGARDARVIAEQMMQGSVNMISDLAGFRPPKHAGGKGGATVVPADAPGPLIPDKSEKAVKKIEAKGFERREQVKAKQRQEARGARLDAVEQEIEAHQQLETRQRILGELHARRAWRLIDLANYTLFLVPLAMEGTARLLLHHTFKEVVAAEAEERENAVAAQELLDAQNSSAAGSSSLVDSVNVSHLPHISFYLPGYLSRMATTLLALNAVLTWAKMVKYLKPFPYIGMLSITLQHAYYETLCFLILFFNVFIGWGMAFSSSFGGHMEQYSTVPQAMMSLFRMLLGDYEFDDMYDVDSTAASVLFVVYIVLVSFLLANMFVALLSNSYMVAKVRVMGDMSAEQNKDKWAGAESFVKYVWRNLTDHRPCRPCKQAGVKTENTAGKREAIESALVWIGGIPEGATEAGLKRLLSRFGNPIVYLRTKEGQRKSWAIAKFSAQGEGRACVQAGNPQSGAFGAGLVLPAIEASEGVDVELQVQWSSEGKMAQQLIDNPHGGLADTWYNMQAAGAVSGSSESAGKATWSPHEQTTLINAMVRGEERKMWELLESTRSIDMLLQGPQKRRLDSALDQLSEEARYLQLSLSPAGVRARARFKKAGLASILMRRLQGYKPPPRQDLAKLAAAKVLGVSPAAMATALKESALPPQAADDDEETAQRNRSRTFGGRHLKEISKGKVLV
jgi:hypothetical protein